MANTPPPPYYAVIFTSERTGNDEDYPDIAQQMVDLAQQQPGYLGFETASENNHSISISYWKDLDSIGAWKENADHDIAQRLGREKWYKGYVTRIALVEKDYSFEREDIS